LREKRAQVEIPATLFIHQTTSPVVRWSTLPRRKLPNYQQRTHPAPRIRSTPPVEGNFQLPTSGVYQPRPNEFWATNEKATRSFSYRLSAI